ncbi:hypothetical protein [Glacieibacterium sp.]|uniref:hypothetical protein n=1 Tax=Glacieibacterium sp. TaxID=2860237 RepID=UPI003B008271
MQQVPGSGEQYALIVFDAAGQERNEGGGLLSSAILAADAPEPTDIFFEVHGWKGDVPAAISQYDSWFGAMARSPSRQLVEAKRPDGFRPLWIGLHWPSLPWGDEEISAATSFAVDAVDNLVEDYVARLGERPGLREALAVVIRHAQNDTAPPVLPAAVRAAYDTLDALLTELPADGPEAPPGEDNPPFDAEASYQALRADPAAFGAIGWGGLLGPLRQLSFWKMKARGRTVGEAGFHALLASLAARFPSARLHLMGHSFGCIAASAAVAGAPGAPVAKVSSLVLVQGALSLWAYCARMPFDPGSAGYFHKLLSEHAVTGPMVTTRSRYDRAVGSFYPLGARVAGQVDFGIELPRYGGVGAFGAQGIADAVDMSILPAGQPYDFVAGRVVNVEASSAIRKGGGFSGAHSDIDGPEVAHLVWSAAATT